MPLPLLLGGIAVGLGVLGHSEAKKINERAEKLSQQAQDIYNEAERKLNIAKNNSEKNLLELGYCKKNILDTSMKRFLESYSKIKKINFKTSINLNELDKFSIKEKDLLELVEMNDIYDKTISTGIAGAATGSAMALAAGGSLGLVSGGLSLAGSALSVGQVGLASTFAGAALTPLAIIAAPIVLFTGISSSLKADKNLEKARTMFAEAELAVANMETSIILCDVITEKSKMFNSLLNELNTMFAKCTILLGHCVKKNTGFFKGKEVDPTKLSEDEKKLIAISRALCGAIKSVIDAPLLNKEGKIHENIDEIHENISKEVVNFNKQVSEIKAYHNVKIPKEKVEKEKTSFKGLVFIILMAAALFLGYKYDQSPKEKKLEVPNTKSIENIDKIKNTTNVINETNKEEVNKLLPKNKPDVKPIKASNKYNGPERDQFILLNGKTVFVDENGYITE